LIIPKKQEADMKNKMLESALKKIKKLQKNGNVFQSNSFASDELTQLKKSGFLREIIRGWYYLSSPYDDDSETTMWYANFWEFAAKYLSSRFKKNYCLNPEISLALHTGDTVVPKQIAVITKNGAASVVNLPHGISMTIYADKKNFPSDVVEIRGLQVQSLDLALCKSGPQYWYRQQKEVEIALTKMTNLTNLTKILTQEDRMESSAGRVVGGLRFVGRDKDADMIKRTYELASGKTLLVSNPFEKSAKRLVFSKAKSTASLRIEAMWSIWRDTVHNIGKTLPPDIPNASDAEEEMDGVRKLDAYHSLSIEGYCITDELIERVSNGKWDPDESDKDGKSRDALAARGYYEAFEAVKHTIIDVIQNNKNMAAELETVHQEWFFALFGPSARAGIFQPEQLAGYRNAQVYLRGSDHVPLAKEELMDAMETYFTLLKQEENPFVCAILGHHLFGFIHPYMDGNGRMARFIMNAFLVTGGYPWAIIKVESRDVYMQALEQASVHNDIEPFARFIFEIVKREL